jgi:mono/diheme cytochrome c family protein
MNRSTALIAIALVLATRGSANEPGHDPLLAGRGAPMYLQYCAACHGRQARGDGPAVKALVRQPADLTTIAARRGGSFPSAEIARFIDGRFDLPAHGSREMPVWGQQFAADFPDPDVGETIARGNIASLIEYLKSIQRPPLGPTRAK